MDSVIFHGNDNAANAAAGGYPVARFELIDHLLPFLLLFLLRHDQQQVENGKYEQHGNQGETEAAASLQQEQTYMVLNHLMTGRHTA